MAKEVELEGIPAIGETVDDKYVVESLLGQGGMGAVVKARHLTLDQPVAIKFLLAAAAKDEVNLHRFQREAKAAARIKSRHVASVTDVGALDSGMPFMVMEYLEGQDLQDRLEDGPLPVTEAITYLLQACEGLAEAHVAGIIHRDLKPANVFLTSAAGETIYVKVLDFGISKVLGDHGTNAALTMTSSLIGSPLYMSPEQMRSAKNIDHRTDIWALGCILYEMLGGRPPFLAPTLPEVCTRILTQAPPHLDSVAPNLPAGLLAAVLRCLEKDPAKRFANVAELALAVAPFGDQQAQRSVDTICRTCGVKARLASVASIVSAQPGSDTGGGFGSIGGVAATPSRETSPGGSGPVSHARAGAAAPHATSAPTVPMPGVSPTVVGAPPSPHAHLPQATPAMVTSVAGVPKKRSLLLPILGLCAIGAGIIGVGLYLSSGKGGESKGPVAASSGPDHHAILTPESPPTVEPNPNDTKPSTKPNVKPSPRPPSRPPAKPPKPPPPPITPPAPPPPPVRPPRPPPPRPDPDDLFDQRKGRPGNPGPPAPDFTKRGN